jgi:hypothetical protein
MSKQSLKMSKDYINSIKEYNITVGPYLKIETFHLGVKHCSKHLKGL